jgi:preprotein translocase subunit YajC
MKRYEILAAVAAAGLIPSIASAQTAPTTAPAAGAQASATASVATGATVYDTSGGVVGTVASTDGTNAVIDTGTNKAAVPLTSLGKGAQGPVLAMTKAQLDAAAGAQQQQASAAFRSQLVTGASVYGSGGTKLGTIKAVDASMVTLTTDKGDAKLPIAGFGPGPQGVTIGMTAAQLSAAMGAGTSADGADASAAATGDDATSTPGTTENASTTPPGATTSTTKKTKPRK